MPFGVNSDPSFRAQKRSIRVRVSSFRTAGTVRNFLDSAFTVSGHGELSMLNSHDLGNFG